MVVTIWTEQPRPQVTRNEFFRRGEESFGGEDFHRFFGQPPGFDRDRSGERNEDQDEQERTPLAATGTGFDDDGLILTNNHVVENATSIQIQFYGDDERYAARVLGRDRLTDSALLELVERPARKLPAARFGDSSRMAPGDWVMAIGAPFGLSHTVTVGVVSALARSMRPVPGRTNEMLQTDAAIKPGQLRWPAAEHPRRGHRHEHGHHQRPRIELGRRLRRADQSTRCWTPARRAARRQGDPRRHRRADRRGAE